MIWDDTYLELSFEHEQNKTNYVLSKYLDHTRLYHGLHHLAFLWKAHKKLSHCITTQARAADVNYLKLPYSNKKISEFILYHDSILIPGSSTNEYESAELWKHMNGGSENDWVYKTILATGSHLEERPIITDEDRFREWAVGLDLLPLAAPRERFLFNNKLIRLEYSHISDELWNHGRTAFIQNLKDKRIFTDSWLHDEFEKDAHDNIDYLLVHGVNFAI